MDVGICMSALIVLWTSAATNREGNFLYGCRWYTLQKESITNILVLTTGIKFIHTYLLHYTYLLLYFKM